MAYPVIWSERALDDVAALATYIARDSEAYARAVAQKILGVGYRLQQFPFSGRVVPEFQVPRLRELLVHGYRVIYRTSASAVTVVTVIHARQRVPPEHTI
jgi:plasmid stabilization system protein ParE